MPASLGTVIDFGSSGESAINSVDTDGGGTSRGNHQSEIINGYDSVEPSTIKFSTGEPGGNSRTTKSGRIDKRTKLGRSGGAGGNEPIGAAGSPKAATVSVGKIDLATLLIGIHMMGAKILSVKEFELSKGEAEALAENLTEIAKYRAIEFNPEIVAWCNLGVCAFTIYGTRIAAYNIRKEIERKNKPQLVARPISEPSKPVPSAATNQAPQTPVQLSPEQVYGHMDSSLE